MDHLILAATEQGLGTCWVGWFNEKKARKALEVPKNLKIIAMTPIGYPDESPKPKVRKTLKEIVSTDQYGK
jgi:nitroreductase